MRLVNSRYQLLLEFQEGKIQVLVVERPETFAQLVQDLFNQMEGREGEFAFVTDDTIISLEKNAELIINPFDLDINNRKNIGKLYQEMKSISQEECLEEESSANRESIRYLNEITMKVPYAVQFNMELDVLDLFKIYGVKLEDSYDSLIQKIIEYIKIVVLLRNVKLVIFINIKNYFNEMQILELYETSFYYKIDLLLIESVQKKRLTGEYCHVLDEQDCLIEF